MAVAFYACLALYGANAQYLSFSLVVRSLVLGVASALCLFLVLTSVKLAGPKAGLISALLLLVFFSYGHLYQLVEGWRIGSTLLGRHRYLLIATLGAGGLLAVAIWRSERSLTLPMELATVAGWLAVALSLVGPLATNVVGPLLTPARERAGTVEGDAAVAVDAQELPDIYYIVLDGYGRADVLRRIYGLDNEPFVGALETMGFFVADEGRANYIQTRLSLAAALNMEYLDGMVGNLPSALAEIRVDRSILDSRVQRILASHGYQLVSFESGYAHTEFKAADIYLTARGDPQIAAEAVESIQLNAYEALLVDTTLLRAPLEWAQRNRLRAAAQAFSGPHQEHRRRIQYALAKLPELARLEGPQFVIVHVLAPHPPFVFDAAGGSRMPMRPYSLRDGSSFMADGTRQEYIDGYRQQVEYLNASLVPVLRALIEQSEVPPVIVLQGDHGPGAHLDWRSAERTDLEERTSILNAIYLQGEQPEDLPASLSTVNTFRVVLNWLFESDLPLLPDRSFYSGNADSFGFVEVELAGNGQPR